MASKPKYATKKPAKGRARARGKDSTLPVTLQALRDRAGFTKEDGATLNMLEFFAESKFSGEPDRKTAIAVVALDTILRDPSMLDASTCFGEGQVDTAVNAATLILGEGRVQKLESISGERDLEELAGVCREMSNDDDIKSGVMAARHLWGMFNTVTRSFPGEFFRNGKSDDFQAALLGVAGRHLAVFSPESMNAPLELSRMIGVAEKIAEEGKGGEYHRNPETSEQVAETFLYLCKNGKHSEIHNNSLLELFGENREPSAKIKALCGLKEKKTGKGRKAKDTEKLEEPDNWTEDMSMSGNGAFFSGRVFEEVKSRYPGYPSHSSESSYWDTCLRHPATHGICSRLYGKMGQLVKSGGVEEGLSRAVTNKMVHHNTKFSRLSMMVHLSDGNSFHVHRTRPINWESHGVGQPPFTPNFINEDGQLELGLGSAPKKATKKSVKAEGEVRVVGFELRVVNYSHMPWVNKAISQYMEEAPFIKSPKDEHQQIVAVLAKELRGDGVTYRQAFDRAADLFSGLTGKAGMGIREAELMLTRAWSRTETAEELEGEMAGLLREAVGRSGGGISEALGQGSHAKNIQEMDGRGREIIQSAVLDLAKACDVLLKYGMSDEKSREVVLGLAGQYPVRTPEDGSGQVKEALKRAGINIEIRPDEASRISKLSCGVASRSVKEAFSLDEKDREELTSILKSVIESGVVLTEDGQKIIGRAGGGDKGEIESFISGVQEIGKRLGVDSDLALEAGEAGAKVASNILPEVERAFAEHGGEASPELLAQLVQYAGKHSMHNPLSGEELHHRRMVGSGVDPVSLDAPMGDEQSHNLYNVVKTEGEGQDLGVDYDADEAAFETGESAHWMDREEGGQGNSPAFISEGGGEFFAPFSSTRIADSLYTVVSTKGTEQQLQMLKDFSGLKVESIAGAGDARDARKQISTMLDMIDEEDVLRGESGSIRRRFLSWVFNSVLNVAGVDGEGFDKMGGIGASTLRKGLFEKIRRYGMPGIVVVEDADVNKNEELVKGIKQAKNWGFTSMGVCLPKTAEADLREWSEKGGAGTLVQLLRHLPESREALAKNIGEGGLSETATRAIGSILGGRGAEAETSQAFEFLQSSPDSERDILSVIKISEPRLHQKLVLGRMASATAMELNCLGDGESGAEIADRAKMDSLVFVDRQNGKAVGEAISSFGIKARVVSSTPVKALSDHVDYRVATTSKDGSLDKNKLIDTTTIPLARKLLLAAEAAQEALDKGQKKGGY